MQFLPSLAFSLILPLGFVILVVWLLYRVTQGHDDSMDTPARSGPKDFFLYLFAFGTLYASVASLIALLFAYVDKLFPDALAYNVYYQVGFEQVRWPMAILFVMVPVFLILSRIIGNDMAVYPEKKEARLYKWLVYLTLFFAGMTMAVDLVTLIYNFLGGETSTRFFLKILVVFVIALKVFLYYRWHLKADLAQNVGKRNLFLWGTVAVVVLSIVAGFFIIGSPMTQRKIRFDEQRVGDLHNIQNQIVNYWQRKEGLPSTLDELNDSISGFIVPLDPVTKERYIYEPPSLISSNGTFKLCATFETQTNSQSAKPYYEVPMNDNWVHGVGYTCFARLIDPELYPKTQLYPEPLHR